MPAPCSGTCTCSTPARPLHRTLAQLRLDEPSYTNAAGTRLTRRCRSPRPARRPGPSIQAPGGRPAPTSVPFSVRRLTWFSVSSTRTNSAATTCRPLAIRYRPVCVKRWLFQREEFHAQGIQAGEQPVRAGLQHALEIAMVQQQAALVLLHGDTLGSSWSSPLWLEECSGMPLQQRPRTTNAWVRAVATAAPPERNPRLAVSRLLAARAGRR